MSRWISLSNARDGFVFAQTHGVVGAVWPWVRGVVAEQYDLREDDLDLAEDGDREYVVDRAGGTVAEVHYGYRTGTVDAAPLVRRVS